MNAEQWAALLHGREYGREITSSEEKQAKKDGVLIFFGYSDDNIEVRGVSNEEVPAYNGTEIRVNDDGGVTEDHDCDCKYCGYKNTPSVSIHADWCKSDQFSWTFRTEVPHWSFDIQEDGEPFCRGIAVDVADIAKTLNQQKEQA